MTRWFRDLTKEQAAICAGLFIITAIGALLLAWWFTWRNRRAARGLV